MIKKKISHLLRGGLIALGLVGRDALDDAVAHGIIVVVVGRRCTRRDDPGVGLVLPVGPTAAGADGVEERLRGSTGAPAVKTASTTRRVCRAAAADAASWAAATVTRLPAVRQPKA